MNKIQKQVGNYTLLEEAKHPKLGVIKLGDNVVFTDDHIIYGTGKDYIEQVKQMFTYGKDTQVYIVVDEVHKDSEYKRTHWASRPMGKYIEEIKKVLSTKELKEINKAKSILSNYV